MESWQHSIWRPRNSIDASVRFRSPTLVLGPPLDCSRVILNTWICLQVGPRERPGSKPFPIYRGSFPSSFITLLLG
ncbi:hypothetical protein TanjilG_31996 [Lupinus angustifolius]|uniref:Uncharacterized protein n=1 Tax=Lupinus angustifolius TaxID=3871 RepID=A0A1J7H5C2_LUPAN|nr:hypothetical protein TanjilG_31996 [Lupinus angustifolius]